jgi:hypothetical protein
VHLPTWEDGRSFTAASVAVRSRVLTSAFFAKLEGSNQTERFRRYPWLETLLNLLAEIDRIQDEVAFKGNLSPSCHYQNHKELSVIFVAPH